MGVAVVEPASARKDFAPVERKGGIEAAVAFYALELHLSVVHLQWMVCKRAFFNCDRYVPDLDRAPVDLDACRMPRDDDHLALKQHIHPEIQRDTQTPRRGGSSATHVRARSQRDG